MRIISGKHKGIRLWAPKNLPVRPTTDNAKEALFNILNNKYYLEDITVLDLFSGTGNISFEFASRGCTKITAVDAHHGCVTYIKKVTNEYEFNIRSLKSDVYKFLSKYKGQSDLIFADPPYDFTIDQFDKIHQLVFENNLLLEDGQLIIEHSTQTNLSHLPHFKMDKKYGGCVISFFEIESVITEEEE